MGGSSHISQWKVSGTSLIPRNVALGLRPPTFDTTGRDAIAAPATGLTIFNTTTGQTEFYNGAAWTAVGGGGTIGDATGGTAGSILFVDASGNLGQDNGQLFWDDTNNELDLNGAFFAQQDTTLFNVRLGSGAGAAITTGANNTLIGIDAGKLIAGGGLNTIVGEKAGDALTSGSNNTFIGQGAGSGLSTTGDNTFVGNNSGVSATGGTRNTGVGFSSLAGSMTGSFNTALGARAGLVTTSGASNTMVGFEAGKALTIANSCTFIGDNSGANVVDGSFNTFFGKSTGRLTTSGASNSFFGNEAGDGNVSGNQNTYVGTNAGWTATASDNVIIGFDAGRLLTSGDSNVFIGKDAGKNFGSNSDSVFIGFQAGLTSTLGSQTCIGYRAGSSLTTGASCTFVGKDAGMSVTDGNKNTLIGIRAGESIQGGDNNTIIGAVTGRSLVSGANNTIIGISSGDLLTGSSNTIVGANSGTALTSGGSNVYLGHFNGQNTSTGGANISIGNSTILAGSTSNSIVIGQGTTSNGFSNVQVYGRNAQPTAANQLVFGSSTFVLNDAYIGEGVTSPTPGNMAINGTGGSGTDIAAGTFIIAGGKATGNAVGGSVKIQTSDVGATGTTLQTLSDVVEFDNKNSSIFSGRVQGAKGADVASATDVTLGADGNYFDITGTTQIDTIVATDWQAGSVVILQFDGAVTVKHNTAGGGASLLLSGAVDFSATANDTLQLAYDGVTWREISRTVI